MCQQNLAKTKDTACSRVIDFQGVKGLSGNSSKTSRKRNPDWMADAENANAEDEDDFDEEDDFKEDSEFNLSLSDGKGYTVYDKRDVMVAVAVGDNEVPVETGSSKKPLLFPLRYISKKPKVYAEEPRETDTGNSSQKASIFDEFYQESECSNTGDSEDVVQEIEEVEEIEVPEIGEATEIGNMTDNSDIVPGVGEDGEIVEVIEVHDMDTNDSLPESTDAGDFESGALSQDEIMSSDSSSNLAPTEAALQQALEVARAQAAAAEVVTAPRPAPPPLKGPAPGPPPAPAPAREPEPLPKLRKPLPEPVKPEPPKIGMEFYKTKMKNSYVLHIPCLSVFTFYGKLRFTLISGKIEVFGYAVDVDSKNKTIDVYSPRRFMQIGIKAALPYSIPDYSQIESALKKKAMLPEAELMNVMNSFSPDDTLVLIERLPSNFSPVLHHYFDEVDLFFEKHVLEEGSDLEKDLDCLLHHKPKFHKIKSFTEGCEWRQIKLKKRMMVCGGKGVGKSTLAKYLLNRCISKRDRVLFVDLDPGQTEFTPPGFVSAVLVRRPLLGPGFTHITKPRKMAYIGTINVALEPVKYMKSVNYILQTCKSDPYLTDIPWFINTMGFNKDIGLDIMINVIRLFRPDSVIQINSSEKSRNYAICFTANVSEIQPAIPLVPIEDEVLYHDLIKTESSTKMRELAIQSGFKPAQVRELMTLAYFSPLLTFPYYSFNAVKPRWIHMKNIYLGVNESIPARCILRALNGSLVGLCDIDGVPCEDRLVVGNSEEVFCKVAIKPEIGPCFGMGLVRAIDIVERKIYVITHVMDRDLSKVNCLLLGSVAPPASIYVKQTYVDKPTIYTDVYDIGNNQKIKRVFNYVPFFNNP